MLAFFETKASNFGREREKNREKKRCGTAVPSIVQPQHLGSEEFTNQS